MSKTQHKRARNFEVRPHALSEAFVGVAVLQALQESTPGATITYGAFSQLIGYPDNLPLSGWQMGQVLDLIAMVPGGLELVGLVVRADTDQPGKGMLKSRPVLRVTTKEK